MFIKSPFNKMLSSALDGPNVVGHDIFQEPMLIFNPR